MSNPVEVTVDTQSDGGQRVSMILEADLTLADERAPEDLAEAVFEAIENDESVTLEFACSTID